MGYLKELKDEIKEILKREDIQKISVSDHCFYVEFFDKDKTVKQKKTKNDTSALDKLYEQPISQEDIDAELEERNRKLRENFANQGNVAPSDGVAVWTGE